MCARIVVGSWRRRKKLRINVTVLKCINTPGMVYFRCSAYSNQATKTLIFSSVFEERTTNYDRNTLKTSKRLYIFIYLVCGGSLKYHFLCVLLHNSTSIVKLKRTEKNAQQTSKKKTRFTSIYVQRCVCIPYRHRRRNRRQCFCHECIRCAVQCSVLTYCSLFKL